LTQAFHKLSDWWRSLTCPDLDWIQLEISTHCNSHCYYCPHTVLENSWISSFLPESTFESLLPALRNVGLLHLQGWGEPLLHPEFFRMVKLAKKAGTRVGTTTNATRLDDDCIRKLIDYEVDIIAISLAGASKRNDNVRAGTKLEQIIDSIRKLKERKLRYGSDKPTINIAYLLLKSAPHELTRLPTLLENSGVSGIVVNTLDFLPGPELISETVFPQSETEYDSWRQFLNRVQADARVRGMTLHYYLRHPNQRRSVCVENVRQALFVNARGDISPCVFTGLPISGDAEAENSTITGHRKLSFGNLQEQGLSQIWSNPAYVDFRDSFLKGSPPEFCHSCPKLYLTEN
jgi:MoaA/NifB/PqqE/SkfB family radical SAM enzyme